jgi:Flp pilus assembly protein TadB
MSVAAIAKILMALSLASVAFYTIEWLSKWIGRRKFSKSLADYYQPLAPQEDRSVRVGSFEHKIRLAALRYRLNVAGRERLYYYGAIALSTMTVLIGLVILGTPPMLYLLAPLVGWAAVNGKINQEWQTMRLALEKELPTFLLRLSAAIQAVPNIPEAISDVAASLDPSGPLQAWMKRLLVAIQSSGRKGMDEMREEAASISPSLFMTILEIERLWQTGGSGYVEAFRLASDNMASILEARSMAAARADGAKSTVRVILIALGGALIFAMSSAAGGALFNTPLVQIGLLLAIAWAIIGWNVIGDMIREAST